MNQQDCQSIRAYLYEQIPLSKAMEVEVIKATNKLVILAAPIKPNINHRSTVFGGSASALAILSAWSLINFRLQNERLSARLVIQKNTISYEKPILKDFEAICSLNETETWARFIKTLQRKKKSRIAVNASIQCQGERVSEFNGVFVALGR